MCYTAREDVDVQVDVDVDVDVCVVCVLHFAVIVIACDGQAA